MFRPALPTNPDASASSQPKLTQGETIRLSGQPTNRIVFHEQDAMLIPFSFLWGGFAIFWEAQVLGSGHHNGGGVSTLMSLWGIPFVVAGQYLIWGRFLYAAWQKKQTFYAVTNRRVIAVQGRGTRRIASAFLDNLPTLAKQCSSNGAGTFLFLQFIPSAYGNRGLGPWSPMVFGDTPNFMDIDDLDSVYRLDSDRRKKLRTVRPPS